MVPPIVTVAAETSEEPNPIPPPKYGLIFDSPNIFMVFKLRIFPVASAPVITYLVPLISPSLYSKL